MTIYNGVPVGFGAVGAWGPQGAIGPSGSSYQPVAVGANGSAGPFTISSDIQSSSALSFRSMGDEVLRISREGGVEWKGKPSKAAEALESVLGNMIDAKAASAGMRQRTYLRACKSLLVKAREMTKDELIEYLEASIANRESKSVMLALHELSKTDDPEG